MSIIRGGNNNIPAKVTAQGRLAVDAITETEFRSALARGKAWNISSGVQTLTSANASVLLYVNNTGEQDLIVDLQVVLTDASTGGSATGKVLVEILKNPTAGTVISDATAGESMNMNFGSQNDPSALVYSGAEGKTLTGQVNIFRSQTSPSNRLVLPPLIQMPKGSSVGARITPPTGNTSMDCEVIFEMYEQEEKF